MNQPPTQLEIAPRNTQHAVDTNTRTIGRMRAKAQGGNAVRYARVQVLAGQTVLRGAGQATFYT
jgi:hypothetical protein